MKFESRAVIPSLSLGYWTRMARGPVVTGIVGNAGRVAAGRSFSRGGARYEGADTGAPALLAGGVPGLGAGAGDAGGAPLAQAVSAQTAPVIVACITRTRRLGVVAQRIGTVMSAKLTPTSGPCDQGAFVAALSPQSYIPRVIPLPLTA
jgi:hypothetical protein